MKKNMLVMLVLLGLFLGVYSTSFAQSYVTSASMPTGAFKVAVTIIDSNGTDDDGVDDIWGATNLSALAFGALKELSGVDPVTLKPWVVFLPENESYFAVDCGFSAGGTVPGKTIKFEYDGTTGTNGERLGYKVVSRYYKITKDPSTDKDVYNELPMSPSLIRTTQSISMNTYINTAPAGWLRALVGIYSGKPKLSLTDIATFSPADPIGSYSGTLKVSLL